MNYKIVKIQEGNSLSYIGIIFSIYEENEKIIISHINKLKDYFNHYEGTRSIPEIDTDEWFDNQQKRDHNLWHITLFTPNECKNNPRLFEATKNEIDDITFKGIGAIARNEQSTFYILLESIQLQLLRNIYSLPPKDFHITIAFSHKDLFHQIKDESTLLIQGR